MRRWPHSCLRWRIFQASGKFLCVQERAEKHGGPPAHSDHVIEYTPSHHSLLKGRSRQRRGPGHFISKCWGGAGEKGAGWGSNIKHDMSGAGQTQLSVRPQSHWWGVEQSWLSQRILWNKERKEKKGKHEIEIDQDRIDPFRPLTKEIFTKRYFIFPMNNVSKEIYLNDRF